MAEKLRSILKQTRWSLALRAALFAFAWLFLPFWAFLIVGLYLYFVPFFQSGKLFWPFFALLLLAFVVSPSLLFFLALGLLFYYLLLIKDLVLIDRRSAYELLILAISFFLIRDYYERFQGIIGGSALTYGFLVAVLIGLFVRGLIGNFADSHEESLPKKDMGISSWLSFIVIWQFLILGLFLPLNFIYQSLIVFLASFAVIDLITEHFSRSGSPKKILTTSTIVVCLFIIVLASAAWMI